jgi:hypothetical protein
MAPESDSTPASRGKLERRRRAVLLSWKPTSSFGRELGSWLQPEKLDEMIPNISIDLTAAVGLVFTYMHISSRT